MGRSGLKRTCSCVDCGARRELSKPDARRERWELWLGGSRCAACVAKLEPHKAPIPEFVPFTETVVVACSACGREMDSTQEYTDGWRPGIHWTKDPDAIQATKDSLARRTRDPKAKVSPLPLCPGWNKAGRVERVERRAVVMGQPQTVITEERP